MIRAQWFALVVCGLLGAMGAAALSVLLPVQYEASARLFLATPTWNDSTVTGEPDIHGKVYTYAFGDEYTQQRAMTYEELANSIQITTRVIERLGLPMTPDELARKIHARTVPDTVMVDIRVVDGSPQQAALLANTVADELSNVVKELETSFKELNSPIIPVLLEPAVPPTTPDSPRPMLNLLAGVVLGLAAGVTYAAVREWYKAARVPRDLTVNEKTLSVLRGADDIPSFANLDDVGHELAEDVRFLCLRLTTDLRDAAAGAQAQTMLFASPRASDSVGSTVVLVGAALAELRHRVAIVLTNLTEGRSGGAEPGLGEVLAGERSLDEVLRYDENGQVGILTAGNTASSSMAALASEEMDSVIERLEASHDYVLVVGTPVLETADCLELASKSATSVLVCPVPPLTGAEIAESERLLGLVPTTLLGRVVVMEGAASPHERTTRSRKVTAEL
jgi:receptor protein-tyrosine kinase